MLRTNAEIRWPNNIRSIQARSEHAVILALTAKISNEALVGFRCYERPKNRNKGMLFQ